MFPSRVNPAIVQSISGDLQIYQKDTKDQLALFGGIGFGTEDIGEIPSFTKLKDAVAKVDNVESVVPMGIANAGVSTPGDLDRALNEMRDLVRKGDVDGAAVLGERVRSIAKIVKAQRSNEAQITTAVAVAAVLAWLGFTASSY